MFFSCLFIILNILLILLFLYIKLIFFFISFYSLTEEQKDNFKFKSFKTKSYI